MLAHEWLASRVIYYKLQQPLFILNLLLSSQLAQARLSKVVWGSTLLIRLVLRKLSQVLWLGGLGLDFQASLRVHSNLRLLEGLDLRVSAKLHSLRVVIRGPLLLVLLDYINGEFILLGDELLALVESLGCFPGVRGR